MNDVPYKDKFWVANEIRKALYHNEELFQHFDWLLKVWNTNRDFEFPSLKENKPEENYSQCGNCGRLWEEKELITPIPNLFERLEPWETDPKGECPTCGCICYSYY